MPHPQLKEVRLSATNLGKDGSGGGGGRRFPGRSSAIAQTPATGTETLRVFTHISQ